MAGVDRLNIQKRRHQIVLPNKGSFRLAIHDVAEDAVTHSRLSIEQRLDRVRPQRILTMLSSRAAPRSTSKCTSAVPRRSLPSAGGGNRCRPVAISHEKADSRSMPPSPISLSCTYIARTLGALWKPHRALEPTGARTTAWNSGSARKSAASWTMPLQPAA